MSLIDEIASRANWHVVIRPSKFRQTKIADMAELAPILRRTAVQLRGRDFPQIHELTEIHGDIDWIGQEVAWRDHREIWRFYQSGQFLHISGALEDWHGDSGFRDPTWPLVPVLGVGNTLFRFTEVFEFAARLSLTAAGDEQMLIGIRLAGLQGRRLWSDSTGPFGRRVYEDLVCDINEYPIQRSVSREELVAESWELGLMATTELFRRFKWDDSTDVLRKEQDELRRYAARR